LPSSIEREDLNQNWKYIVSFFPFEILNLLTSLQAPVQHLLDYRPTNLLDDLFDRSPYMTNVHGLPDETTDARWKALYDSMKQSQL
jgi:hypothetical protein